MGLLWIRRRLRSRTARARDCRLLWRLEGILAAKRQLPVLPGGIGLFVLQPSGFQLCLQGRIQVVIFALRPLHVGYWRGRNSLRLLVLLVVAVHVWSPLLCWVVLPQSC